jgi:tetratricopeptide (TPR) repeat protein
MGLAQEAVLELERALEEDLLNIWWRIVFATALLAAGTPAEPARELYCVLELDPSCHQAYYYLAGIQAARRLYTKAYSCARKAWLLAPLAPLNIALRATALRSAGRRGAARKLLAGLADENACQVPMARSVYHLICSEIDEAANWAEKQSHNASQRLLGYFVLPWLKTFGPARDGRRSPG